mmetsp:Transcript_68755/g.163779  ORF Transcript_68755/g.163779 Transcript_68755/m.163779 type:complete len:278 (+) Transcript_68755:105-938(+)
MGCCHACHMAGVLAGGKSGKLSRGARLHPAPEDLPGILACDFLRHAAHHGDVRGDEPHCDVHGCTAHTVLDPAPQKQVLAHLLAGPHVRRSGLCGTPLLPCGLDCGTCHAQSRRPYPGGTACVHIAVHGMGNQRAHPADLGWLLQHGPTPSGDLAASGSHQHLCDSMLGGHSDGERRVEVVADCCVLRYVRLGLLRHAGLVRSLRAKRSHGFTRKEHSPNALLRFGAALAALRGGLRRFHGRFHLSPLGAEVFLRLDLRLETRLQRCIRLHPRGRVP